MREGQANTMIAGTVSASQPDEGSGSFEAVQGHWSPYVFGKYHHRSFRFFLSRDSETFESLTDFKIRCTIKLK